MQKQKFEVNITAQNNFSVLNRIINILNRRRIRVISLIGKEGEKDPHFGVVKLIIYSEEEILSKALLQIEKIIEVEKVLKELIKE